MKVYDTNDIRNVALIGHGHSGKTSLASGLLFTSGTISRLARVDEGGTLTDFDKEVDALRAILGMKRVMTVDELRRGIEAIPEADYHRLSDYRRWIRSIADTLLRKGVITEAELRAALDRV